MVTLTIGGADTGTITLTESAGAISAISPTFDGATIQELLNGAFGADNVFYAAGPYFDYSGVSFDLQSADSDGGSIVVLLYNNGSYE